MRLAFTAASIVFAYTITASAQQPPQPAGEEPPHPTVSDPMLTPPPPSRRIIATWDDAMQLVRSRSTDLRIAYDEVRRAEAQSRVALAGALPNLSAQGTASHRILPTSSSSAESSSLGGSTAGKNSLEGRISFSQPIIDVRAWHAIGTAHVGEEVAKLSYEDLERTIAADVASAIVSTVTAERVAEINRVGLRNALERLALTEAKERTGTATGLDIVRAKQDVASTRTAVVNGDESLRQAREALALALGLTDPVGVAPTTDLSSIERGALRSCRSVADIEARADVAAARKRLEIAKRNVTDVEHQYLPTLSAESTLGVTVDDSGSAARSSWNIAAVLSVPIWDGGARYGLRRNAVAQEDESLQQLEALRRSATVGLSQAQRAVQVAEQARAVATEARDLAADVDRLTLSAYATGKGTSLDVVVAASALRQAELNLALQEFAVVRARIDQLLALATCRL